MKSKFTRCARPFENEETRRMGERFLAEILDDSFDGWYKRLLEKRYKELMTEEEQTKTESENED